MSSFWTGTAPWIVAGWFALFLAGVGLYGFAVVAEEVRRSRERRQINRLERLFAMPARDPVRH